MRAILAAAILLALAPLAEAGTAADPEAPDESGDAAIPNAGFGDITAVWAEAANGTLHVTMQVADYAQAVPNAYWIMGFRLLDVEYVVEVSSSAGQGSVTHGAMVGTADGDMNATEVVVTLGAPGTFRVKAANVKPGQVVELTTLRTAVVMANGGLGFGGFEDVGIPGGPPAEAPTSSTVDEATALRPYSVPYPPQKPVVDTTKKDTTTNTTKPVTEATTPTTNTTKNTTAKVNETVSLDSNDAEGQGETAATPDDRGFLGLPGPGAAALVSMVGFLALASRRFR